jgi:ATP-dependent DNA helicase RecG
MLWAVGAGSGFGYGRQEMRPEILFSLFTPVTTLPGVGKRTAALIERLTGPRIIDLCFHLPIGMVDRRFAPALSAVPDGAVATLTVHVDEHQPARSRRMPYRVICSDDSGELTLVFFHAKEDYLRRVLPEGETRVVSGKAEYYKDKLQITHPDHIAELKDIASLQRVEPVYPLTVGLTPKPLAKAIAAAVELAPQMPEWQDAAYLAQQGWPSWHGALETAHRPDSEFDLSPRALARQRLAFDELLANQLALGLVRRNMRGGRGRVITGNGELWQKVLAALPYTLTGAQKQSVEEIGADMSSHTRMLRLLQGDVGSGKTVVALGAMLIAVEAGGQAALMAPTEILARQHFDTLKPLLDAAGVHCICLTGRDKGKAREQLLAEAAGGDARIVIGTHAIFQETVSFQDLALAVIDEQHRFGVHQRLSIAAKGQQAVDVLVMTATPIPRTLTLTAYGDMDVSRLTEKPPGRTPIDTRAVPLERLPEIIGGVERAVASGAQVYWVCPLVEESEDSDLAAVDARHASLTRIMGDQIGLIHGRMKGPEKDDVMAAFSSGALKVLVATTVIEVGVDVPSATVMVIEHAERFGLAQLHQLRGRVGRGADRSSCLLLYAPPLTETARARIEILRETDDGFRIAEEDLRLRGAGEVMGTRQSGLPVFRLADLSEHGELLAAARDDARLILERDPELEGARGEPLRVLLYLFERDAAVRYLRSG